MGNKVYIAGPMSGYEEFNFPAFNRVEELLRGSYGYKHVINPAKLHPTTDLPWVEFLKQDGRSHEEPRSKRLWLTFWVYAFTKIRPCAITNRRNFWRT